MMAAEESADDEKFKLLNQKEIAKMLNVSVSTLNRLVKSDSIPQPAVQTGRKLYWFRSQIEVWYHVKTRQNTSKAVKSRQT